MRGFLLFVAALVALRLLGVGAHPAPRPPKTPNPEDERYRPPVMLLHPAGEARR
jgi:hypothetical protein